MVSGYQIVIVKQILRKVRFLFWIQGNEDY